MESTSFGKLLRELRLAKGLSQESLAERAAMSVNGISALERGANQTPQRKTLELLVKALALSDEQAGSLQEAATRPSRPRTALQRRPLHFPRQLTPFFGRREILSETAHMVDELPVVTLTGPGGIGKTRLALRVADELQNRYPDGSIFVDAAPLRDYEAVFGALAPYFDAPRSLKALIVIDNCEHLASAVAAAVERLVLAHPELRILTTSRQPLGVSGEQILRVPPLERDAGVALFVERARRAGRAIAFSQDETDAIARVVTRLDGIALAIELAAARMNVLTLSELEIHLSERFDVLSGTMRATMDWSYELLSSRERSLLCRLCVFAGSFSLDAAVAVCGKPNGKWEIFESLASLVDKSLLNSAPQGEVQRYRLLETTRAYAAQRPEAQDEAAQLSARHAAYYKALAECAAATLDSTGSTAEWAQSLEPDLENFRTALDWTLARRGDIAAGVQLLSNLEELWIVEGIAAEADRRARDVLNADVDLTPGLQAALWLTIARMTQELFVHPGRTLDAAQKARELYETSGDRRGLALALRQEAAAHMRLGAHSQARFEFARSLELYEEIGDLRMAARGRGYLASLLQVQGEFAHARTMLLDVLASAQAAGDDRMIPTIAMNLAEAEFALGNVTGAVERASANLLNDVLQKSSDMVATQEANLAVYLLALGRMEDAREMARASLETSSGTFIAVPLQHLAASIARADPPAAARILGYVDAAFESTAFVREHTERYSYDYLISALEDALEKTMLESYRREGAAMSAVQVLALIKSASGISHARAGARE